MRTEKEGRKKGRSGVGGKEREGRQTDRMSRGQRQKQERHLC